MSERNIVERLRDGCPGCNRMECKAADEIESLRAEIAELREERRQREALWQACANHTRVVYGNVFIPKPLPPGPEGEG